MMVGVSQILSDALKKISPPRSFTKLRFWFCFLQVFVGLFPKNWVIFPNWKSFKFVSDTLAWFLFGDDLLRAFSNPISCSYFEYYMGSLYVYFISCAVSIAPNYLEGSIPSELARATNLEVLMLSKLISLITWQTGSTIGASIAWFLTIYYLLPPNA